MEIRLNTSSWNFDPARRLGPPGGFGEVFVGSGAAGPVAVKRLKLSAGAAAYREMKMGEFLVGQEFQHVVPVLDFGQDAESDAYYLVMPICDGSLDDHIAKQGKIDWIQARDIALQVLAGLTEVDQIVHRDLKPGNILFHEGRWKLADFGIAKFVADSTSLQTLRDSLTAAYGAPEQWRMEAPKKATDIYALGCIFHAMIDGSPPFNGSVEEVREAHLTKAPPGLINAPSRLVSLVSSMLRKPPDTRPTVARCVTVLSAIEAASSTPANEALAAAGQKIAAEKSRREAEMQAARQLDQQRKEIAQTAISTLMESLNRLSADIHNVADATTSPGRVILGDAELAYAAPSHCHRDFSGDISSTSPMEIFAQSSMRVSQKGASRYTFAATLFYGRIAEGGDLRWHEVSFWNFGGGPSFRPFAVDVDSREFAEAFWRGMASTNIAYGPWAIDDEAEGQFHERWTTLFARAADGRLVESSQMPIPAAYFMG